LSKKQPTSMRCSPEAIGLLEQQVQKLGLSRTGVIAMAVRRQAEVEKIP
jgi:hypothetical protein